MLSQSDKFGLAAAFVDDLHMMRHELFICKEQARGLRGRELASFLFNDIAIGQHV